MRSIILVLSSVLAVAGCSADTSDETVGTTEEGLTTVAHCSSIDRRYNTCDIDTNGGRIVDVRVAHQISGARCEEGRTFGFGRDYIWVDDGCRAAFEVRIRQAPPLSTERIRCSSISDNYAYCRSELEHIVDIRLVRQFSSSDCKENRTFGFYDGAIWVDDGCRGEFEVRGYR